MYKIFFFLGLFIILSCEHNIHSAKIVNKSIDKNSYKTSGKSEKETLKKKESSTEGQEKLDELKALKPLAAKENENLNKINEGVINKEEMQKKESVKSGAQALKIQENTSKARCDGFFRPVKTREVLVNFGDVQSEGIKSDGIVFKITQEEPVKAAKNGEVVYVGKEFSSYGNIVILKHDGNFFSIYGNLKDAPVKTGQFLKMGEIISSTSVSDGKFYFEIRIGKTPVNPSFCN